MLINQASPRYWNGQKHRDKTSRYKWLIQYSTAWIVNIVVVITCTRCNATLGRKIVRIDWMCICGKCVRIRLNNLVEWFERRVEKKRLDFKGDVIFVDHIFSIELLEFIFFFFFYKIGRIEKFDGATKS